MKMKWFFPKNDGGQDSGFHDAGVETFKGNSDRYLARELIQNCLDARLDPNKPVHVKFAVEELDRREIPDIEGLKVSLERCAEYWGSYQKKAREFFERAAKLASAKKITVLRVSDFNTTGVLGSDTEREKNWYNLIRSSGSSSKTSDEGGSFGIGKNAPFAASQLRTVFYSTYNADNEHIFQGVAKLVSHQLPKGGKAQSTGFLGDKDGLSVREKSEIPASFLRKQRGTDIIVLGFQAEETWRRDLMRSVVQHFWPAIDWRDLVVSVGEDKINADNLEALLESFSGGDEEFNAHLYYHAYKNAPNPFHEKLPTLKAVSLYLMPGEADLPKRVAMIRKTGMVIFAKQFKCAIPFCGVFICKNEAGNRILREMEPPRHDEWDPNHPEKNANKKTEHEYGHFIRECIKQLLPVDDSKVILLSDLSRFLPDDDDSPDAPFDTGDGERKESLERSPLPEKIAGRKIDPRRAVLEPDNAASGEGEEPTGDGGDEGDGGPGNGAGGRRDGYEGGEGGTGGDLPKPIIPITYRTFATNISAGVYMVSVRPEKNTSKKVNLAVWAVGDDQRTLAEIQSARLLNGKDLEVSVTGLLGPVSLPKNETLQFEVRLTEALRVAMEVSAHEA